MEFNEIQKFNKPWVKVVLVFFSLVVCFYCSYTYYDRYINHREIFDSEFIATTIYLIVVFAGLCIFFSYAKLMTVINKEGVSFLFSPFHRKFRVIEWNEIENFEVVTYRPLLEYGGWGIRFGFKGRAFNVAGNKGLQLTLKNGRRILIGTQKEAELKEFLTHLK